jgi:hypothetical protein
MRYLVFGGLIAAILITTNREPQAAPWCSLDSNGNGNCGFYTFQQCQEYLSGLGGQCEANLWEEPMVVRGPSYRVDPYPAPQVQIATRHRARGHWHTVRSSDGWLVQRHSRTGTWRAVPSDPNRRVAYRWTGEAWVPVAYAGEPA